MAYGVLVLFGVVVVVFLVFQAFGDPARMVLGQTGDKKTMENIRKELYLDQPKWKQFVFYVNDISPVSIDSKTEIKEKGLRGFFIPVSKNENLAFKIPYLRRSYQTKKQVTEVLMEALPGTIMLATAAMFFYHYCRNIFGNIVGGKTKYMDRYLVSFCQRYRYFCTFVFYGDRHRIYLWFGVA